MGGAVAWAADAAQEECCTGDGEHRRDVVRGGGWCTGLGYKVLNFSSATQVHFAR